MDSLLPALRSTLLGREADLIALRRDLHAHPELSFAETRTSALVADRLHRAGIELHTGIAGTGLVALVRGDRRGRAVAWRADMDALPIQEAVDSPFRSHTPDVMHACGHDGHTAIAVILAESFAAHRGSLTGDAVFVFQPAEEVFSGARPMLDAGILDAHRVDEIYGLHLSSRFAAGHVEAFPGVSMASADLIEIEVTGRGGHGASPQDAIDPISIAAQIVVGIPTLVASIVPEPGRAALTITQVFAGAAPNIIPDVARLRGSVRALRADDRDALLAALAAHVDAIAERRGATARIRALAQPCPALVNHAGPTERVHLCATEEVSHAHISCGEAVLASDDMSLFLAQRPGCYFRVGAAPDAGRPVAHHSAHFEIDERALIAGARVAASVLLDALDR